MASNSTVKRGLTEIEKWRAKELAANGGFSHKAIAARVFGVAVDKLTDQELTRVKAFLSNNRIKVTDWRNMGNIHAIHHAKSVISTTKQKKALVSVGLVRDRQKHKKAG